MKKLPSCEIIANFSHEDFPALAELLPLGQAAIFTDSLVARQTGLQLGYDINEFRQYFGYVNPELYSIYEEGIRHASSLEGKMDNVKSNGVKIVDGMKSYLLERVIFLAKMKSILEKKRDVVFLFSNLSYHYFAVSDLALKMGYQSKYGVSALRKAAGGGSRLSGLLGRKSSASKPSLSTLDFKQAFASNYGSLYEAKKTSHSSVNAGDRRASSFSPAKLGIDHPPQFVFFLVNNEEDFYLKPVYPVLNKFSQLKVPFVIFTFSTRTAKQLEKMNYNVYDLSPQASELEKEYLQQNNGPIADFLNLVSSLSFDEDVLQCYVPRLKNDVIVRSMAWSLAVIEIVRAIFDNYRFKSVLVDADGVSENDIVCSISKAMSIPSYSILPAMTEGNPIYRVLYNASKLLLSGPRLKEELKSLGVDENRLVVVGNPRYDYAATASSVSGEKLVVVAMSRAHDGDEDWMTDVIRFCDKAGYNVFIKMHPAYKYIPDFNQIAEQKIAKIHKNCPGMSFTISYDADLTTLLPKATMVITEYSLVGVEAALLGKPVIVANLSGEKYYPYSLQFHNEKIALYAASTRELLDCIARLIKDTSIRSQLAQGCEQFNHDFNYLNDGKAAERIFNVMTGLSGNASNGAAR
jgi:hypothetical protein